MKYVILALFILTYVMIIAMPNRKPLVTGISALVMSILMIASSKMKFFEPLLGIKLDVIFMLAGIMLTVGVFSQSNMPNKLADKLISKIPNALVACVILSLLSGIVSAFVDNVATVLMLAPIGISVAKKTGCSPVALLISIAVSSNLQGAATLVGDTTSIMLADALGMSFFDFFVFNGKASIFWAVELGMVATIPVLIFIFRKDNKKLNYISEEIKVTSIVPTIFLLATLACLVINSFVGIDILINGKSVTNGIICLFFGILAVAHYVLTKKNTFKACIKEAFDYETILFLTFLFIIIGIVDGVGIIKDLSKIFASIGANNMLLLYVVIVLGSVILSAFIDNIPYVATMLPVIAGLGFANPTVLYFGLLIGATLGGNITPVGASANVVAIGILRKEGFAVKNSDFFKIGIPFTAVAVLSGAIYTWLVFGI